MMLLFARQKRTFFKRSRVPFAPLGSGTDFRTRILPCFLILWAGLVLSVSSLAGEPEKDAREILKATGLKGGLIVHLDCDDGKLTSALYKGDGFVVQGLTEDPEQVVSARKTIRSSGCYGPVSAVVYDGTRLPYIDNVVTLLVCEHRGSVSKHEMMRVLSPGGIVCIQENSGWDVTVKRRPDEMDEWRQYLHGSGNNAVSDDGLVDQPFRMQWTCGPEWARHHNFLASVSVMVSAGRRVFSIEDRGPIASLDLPSEWFLVARDAFNGICLWKRKISRWEGRFRRFRSGPPAIGRRLAASGSRIYVTLGYQEPVTALEASTGKTLHVYEETKGASEFVYTSKKLYVAAGRMDSVSYARALRRGKAAPPVREKRIMALDAHTGELLWKRFDKETHCYLPTTLCMEDGRVFFQNTVNLVCLDAETGKTLWKFSRPSRVKRRSWSAPTLVVHKGVLLSADCSPGSKVPEEPEPEPVQWNVTSGPKRSPAGEGRLIALSASDGKKLWECKTAQNYTAPADIFVSNNVVWTGTRSGRNNPDYKTGRDLFSGKIVKELNTKEAFTTTHHHRCYRDKATQRHILMGRTGVEFIPFNTQEKPLRHCWIRGGCQYGVMPANGLLYLPPHACACYIQSKLDGFWALAPRRSEPYAGAGGKRLEKGPSYGKTGSSGAKEDNETQWPTYRSDPERSGRIAAEMAPQRRIAWKAAVDGKLTGIVAGQGLVLTASKDKHTVWAFDGETGRDIWRFTCGGRIDSPATIYRGKAVFGSADGYVYCLRLSDGTLAWRFRAAPHDLRTVSYGQVESLWPVTGSVLIHEGRIYCFCGRSSFLDGGMTMYQLEPETGKVLAEKSFYSRDPVSGREPEELIEDVELPGMKPDVLVCDGEWIYLRDRRLDEAGKLYEPTVPHIYSSVGLLDGHWFHRTYWQWGERTWGRYSGWHVVDEYRPSGRILVTNEKDVFGYGRRHVGPADYNLNNFHLFRASKKVIPVDKEARKITRNNNLALRKYQKPAKVKYFWTKETRMVVRAMVLAKNVLFAAGPLRKENGAEPVFTDPDCPSVLAAFSAETGKKLFQCRLPCQPVFDGMAAAFNRLYISLIDGRVVCLEGKSER